MRSSRRFGSTPRRTPHSTRHDGESDRGATYSGVFTLAPLLSGERREHHGYIAGEAAALADAGLLAPRLDPRAFTLDTADEALDLVGSNGAAGKVAVRVDESR